MSSIKEKIASFDEWLRLLDKETNQYSVSHSRGEVPYVKVTVRRDAERGKTITSPIATLPDNSSVDIVIIDNDFNGKYSILWIYTIWFRFDHLNEKHTIDNNHKET